MRKRCVLSMSREDKVWTIPICIVMSRKLEKIPDLTMLVVASQDNHVLRTASANVLNYRTLRLCNIIRQHGRRYKILAVLSTRGYIVNVMSKEYQQIEEKVATRKQRRRRLPMMGQKLMEKQTLCWQTLKGDMENSAAFMFWDCLRILVVCNYR